MARVLKELPRHTKQRKYDWKKWADGRPWELTAGKDFQVSVSAFCAAAYRYASAIGATVETRTVEKGVLAIQFTKPAPRKTKTT